MRSPLRALINKTPVPYVSSRNLTMPWVHRTGAEAQMRAMGSVGTLFAIVNRTSNATAQVEWKLWRKAPSGLPEDRTEVTSHAALDLWNKPNPFMTRQEFVESFQQHIDLTGEGWWVMSKNPRSPLPLELWPIRPDRIDPVPHPTDFLTGYVYRGPAGEEIPLEQQDVVQLRTPNPLDPYRGMGPVQSILMDLDATRYSAEWNRNFFLNSAEPGGIIEVPDTLSDTEFDELRARWNEQHRGVANAHRVAILEKGTWKDRKFTQRDMQFAELRGVSRDTIREAFGVPAFVLGEVGDVNRATAEASKALFAELLTVPRLERIKQALNNDLLPLYGPGAKGLEFDYCDPTPPDLETQNAALTAKAQAAQALRAAGWNGDDVLSAVGLPDMESPDPREETLIRIVTGAPSTAPMILPLLGFDLPTAESGAATPRELTDMVQKIYLGVNTVLTWEEARQILAAAGAPINPTAPRPAAPATAPQARSLSAFDLARARQPRRAIPGSGLRNADDEEEEQLAAARTLYEAALAQLLEDWEPVSAEQRDALIEQIRQAVADEDAAALAAVTAPTEAAAAVLTAALVAMHAAAAEQMAAEAAEQGVEVAPPPPDEEALGGVAVAVVGLLAAGLAGAAAAEALRLFTPGVDAGDVAAAVREFLEGLSDRALRDHLGGALHRAQNGGRFAVLEAAPEGVYIASEEMDSGTCGPCRAIDGTVFSSLGAAREAYGAGGYRACEGGIRCRGTVVGLWDGAQ